MPLDCETELKGIHSWEYTMDKIYQCSKCGAMKDGKTGKVFAHGPVMSCAQIIRRLRNQQQSITNQIRDLNLQYARIDERIVELYREDEGSVIEVSHKGVRRIR